MAPVERKAGMSGTMGPQASTDGPGITSRGMPWEGNRTGIPPSFLTGISYVSSTGAPNKAANSYTLTTANSMK